MEKILGLKEASLQQNGWHKFPSGLIIQWGQFTLPVSNPTGAQNLIFPIAFPNACHIVVATNISTTNYAEGLELGAIQKNGVGIGTYYMSGSSVGSYPGVASWLAIGY